LTAGEAFDLNQMMNGGKFFIGKKATVFSCIFDLDQIHLNQL
jgi:hypothetical protein